MELALFAPDIEIAADEHHLLVRTADQEQPFHSARIFYSSTELEESLCDFLLTKLKTLQNTPEEDRFPGADWPTDQAFEEAEIFIRTLPFSIPMPDMGLGDDGEVSFLWEYEGVEIDLGLYGTQTYSYYACDKDGKEYLCNQASIAEGLTDDLQNILTG